MKYIALILIGLLAVLSSGCATVTSPHDPGEEWTPPKWDKSIKKPDEVWKNLRERVSVPSSPLSLAEVIEEALVYNPAAKKAMQDAKAAQARIKQAESSWFPNVNVSAQVQRERDISNTRACDVNETVYGPQAELTFLLLDFGGRASRVKQALHSFIAYGFTFNQTIQDVILEVERAYFNMYSAEASLDSAAADVADANASYIAADQKFKAGLVAELEVLQARSTLDNAQYVMADAKGAVKIARGQLAQAMGLPADADFSIEIPKKQEPPAISSENVSDVIDFALSKRPDIAALRASVRSKEAAAAAAASDLWPTLNLGASAQSNQYAYYGVEKNNPLLDKDDRSYSGYISVGWDIFDGFNNYARLKEAQALAKAERDRLEQAEIAASSDVWQKYYAYNTAVSKLVFGQSYYESSRSSYDLAFESYKAGLKSILDLLESQKQLSSSRSTLISAKTDMFISLAEFIHSTGTIGRVNE